MEHPAKIVDGITCLSTRATGLKCQSVVLREAKYLPRQLFRLDTRADGNGEEIFRSSFVPILFIAASPIISPIITSRDTTSRTRTKGNRYFLFLTLRKGGRSGRSEKKKFRTPASDTLRRFASINAR